MFDTRKWNKITRLKGIRILCVSGYVCGGTCVCVHVHMYVLLLNLSRFFNKVEILSLPSKSW